MIKVLVNEDEVLSAFPVINQLRPHLTIDAYKKRVQEAKEAHQYELAGVFNEKGEIVAAAGYMPKLTLYDGHSVWVCDLVVSEKERSKGHGERLLRFVEERSKKWGCVNMTLSSGLQRHDAHRFYEEKVGFERKSYTFKREFI
ncbi:GNAT family N-acetyltransferase [Priestia endophytica]|uniref:GNAT family N-acetyltransferase n=1 Tax=Priestia endophytica TaxID=135735 RepID=UPI00227F76B9|nr:GNAT family N-acetyltransferase [Priestia endophytica]MCY8230415.1 GNAT family N-acetyltransferase [Priestia endophytica]